jgi:hypothetical protein
MIVNPWHQERCTLSIDYAYTHVFFCILQFLVLRKHFTSNTFYQCHAFACFAFAADYCFNFMKTGTRTLAYPVSQDSSVHVEVMGPIGEFLFFLWYDYSAFGILLWAKQIQDLIGIFMLKGVSEVKFKLSNKKELFSLLIVPLQFGSAPLIASYLSMDDRVLILTRISNKNTYAIMLAISCILLSYGRGLQFAELLPILTSGILCGIVHHGALFYHGMRGYKDFGSLFLTLVTEWPALITAIAAIEQLGSRAVVRALPFLADRKKSKDEVLIVEPCGAKWVRNVLLITIFALLGPHLMNIDDDAATSYLIPYVNGKYMQSIGTAYMRVRTCLLPKYFSLLFPAPMDCWEGSNDMHVLASAAKSGALLSAQIAIELGRSCGICVASGERSTAGIPGPIEALPVYDGRLLHAIVNMRGWPAYVKQQGFDVRSIASTSYNNENGGQVTCVTLLRDPLARLQSLYTYARSGGEHWFRFESGLMKVLTNPKLTLPESVDRYWELFGKSYLLQSHEYMSENLKLGCTGIFMEDVKNDFNTSVVKIFNAFKINANVHDKLLMRLAKSDGSRKSEIEKVIDPHFTSSKFKKGFVKEVNKILMDMSEVRAIVEQQRADLSVYLLRE